MRQVALFTSLLAQWFLLAQFVDAQVLAVRIHNVSLATQQDIADLEEAATAAFEHAAVKVAWTDCTLAPAACAAPSDRTNITLFVVNERGSTGHHAIGWTTLGSYTVTVHYRRAGKMAQVSTLHLSCGRILGYTAAHEIGHLVLESPKHGLFGIMKSAYNNRDLLAIAQGRLHFTNEDAVKMRGRLALAKWIDNADPKPERRLFVSPLEQATLAER